MNKGSVGALLLLYPALCSAPAISSAPPQTILRAGT